MNSVQCVNHVHSLSKALLLPDTDVKEVWGTQSPVWKLLEHK